MPPERHLFRSFFDSISSGYRSDVVLLGDGQYYWHLYRYAERINGGLSANRYDAVDDARQAARRDYFWRRPHLMFEFD